MKKHFDIIVIGAGSGGLNVASFMNRIGLSVLLVEKSEETIGGDCLNYGCVPSKAFIHAARTIASARNAKAFGLRVSGKGNLKDVMSYVKERQDTIREHENAAYFREKGIEVVIGEARFTSEDSINVSGTEYSGERIIIATGSHPRMLDINISDEMPVYTNETIFSADELPEHLVVIGGGPIGFEIGQSFARLGSSVTILNRDNKWLAKEDRDAVDILLHKMKEEGVTFIPNVSPVEVRNAKELVVKKVDGSTEVIMCDALFVSIGRELNLNLDLEKAGIERERSGKLLLSEYLETSNKRVFAVGDAVGQHQFTHAAEVHVGLIASNFFKPHFLWKKLNTDHMAWVTYTDPEIATFGLSPKELEMRGISYEVIEERFSESDRAITDNRTEGFLRVYVGRRGKVLGGTMVGEHAGELVSELIHVMAYKKSIGSIFYRVFPYPTAARINRLIAGKFLGRKLTNQVKKILTTLYRSLA